jgi:hypothetical protein
MKGVSQSLDPAISASTSSTSTMQPNISTDPLVSDKNNGPDSLSSSVSAIPTGFPDVVADLVPELKESLHDPLPLGQYPDSIGSCIFDTVDDNGRAVSEYTEFVEASRTNQLRMLRQLQNMAAQIGLDEAKEIKRGLRLGIMGDG